MFDMYVSEIYESVGRPSVMLEMVKIKKNKIKNKKSTYHSDPLRRKSVLTFVYRPWFCFVTC